MPFFWHNAAIARIEGAKSPLSGGLDQGVKKMTPEMKLLLAIHSIKPLSRAMRSFWVGSKGCLASGKDLLRYRCRKLSHIEARDKYRTAALSARCRNASKGRQWLRESYLMQRRPGAFWTV